MPAVVGFLRAIRRGGRPSHPIAPGGGEPTDPDYGIEEGVDPGYGVEGPEVDPIPDPPPGIWPPLTPSHPIEPLPPVAPGAPGQLPTLPPGSIWPRPPGPVQGLFIALVHIPSLGWRYVVIDPDGIELPDRPPPRPTPTR